MRKWVIHMSGEEAAGEFASLMARVRAGEEVIIESGAQPVAILKPPVRLLSKCLRLARVKL